MNVQGRVFDGSVVDLSALQKAVAADVDRH
jgi:hypothetical protein